MRDPIVEEVRAVRQRIEEECGGNRERYYRRLRQVQERYIDRVVTLGPKRVDITLDGRPSEQEPLPRTVAPQQTDCCPRRDCPG